MLLLIKTFKNGEKMQIKHFVSLLFYAALFNINATTQSELHPETTNQLDITTNRSPSIICGISNERFIKETIPEYVTCVNRERQIYFLENIFRSNISDANEKMKTLRENALKIITFESILGEHEPLPHITHKVWITDPNNPNQIPEITLALVKEQYLNLPDYQHLFWTNCPEELEPSFYELRKLGINFEIHHTDELARIPARNIFNAYVNQNMFAFASDIVRLQITATIGGIYTDMGWPLKREISRLLLNFDYAVNGEFFSPGIVSHNFIAAKPNNRILTSIISFFDNKEFLKYCNEKGERLTVFDVASLSGPQMMSAAFASLSDENTKLLLLTNTNYTFGRFHNHSWFGINRKFGQTDPNTANIELFKRDIFEGII